MNVEHQHGRRVWKRAALVLMIPMVAASAVLWGVVGRVSGAAQGADDLGVIESQAATFRVEVVAEGLTIPWGMAFLPDGRALVTEREGRLTLLDLGSGELIPVGGVPPVFNVGQGGLLDIALHPDYASNGWIYFSYSARMTQGATTVVDRARLDGHRLVERERIFTARPFSRARNHFGGRLVLHDGYLFLSIGERTDRHRAQLLDAHNGKVVRVRDDGRIPSDNPFADHGGALPEVWSYGHRNPQGLTRHPETGELWEHEHGPRGGDEVNIIRPGRNYGWPVISYGREYRGGPVGEGITHQEGMEQPVHYYVPSIAPSGMVFYRGDTFPAWRGNLFIGALAMTHLNRLVIDGNRVVQEERLLEDRNWRVRFVREGLDGYLYLGVDDGLVVRLRPE
jgi:glucose/arabinose dehydrogenase